MSKHSGLAALNLEMTPMVPRTEYSAEYHPLLVKAVTGIALDLQSPRELINKAAGEFMKVWDYAIHWNVCVHSGVFRKYRARMGHSAYAYGGGDCSYEKSCFFKNEQEALAFDPRIAFDVIEEREWVTRFNEDYKKVTDMICDTVNMTGTYVTCISGLIELLGWELLLTAAGTDPKAFGELAGRYAGWMMPFFRALAQCDAPVIMVHDDIVWTEGPFIHPDWYREFVFPYYKKFFAPILEAGKKLLFTSDGNYMMFLEDIAKAGAHGFVLEPVNDLKAVAERFGKTHVIVGNADTRAILSNDKESIYNEVKRCMDIGRHCPGYIMAVGNHIPSNTPVEAALYYDEVYRKLARR